MVNKSLYGQKQSGREWNSVIDKWLQSYAFKRSRTEPVLYVYNTNSDFVLVLIYVDDIVCAPKNASFKIGSNSNLYCAFGFKDKELVSKYLGVEVEHIETSWKIHQLQYCAENLKRFKYAGAYKSRILMATNTRFQV